MKTKDIIIGILVVALLILLTEKKANGFASPDRTLTGVTDFIVTQPGEYTVNVQGDRIEAAAGCSYYGDNIAYADGNIPKPFCTWATFRSGGTKANKTMVKAGMVMGAWSADGYYPGVTGQAEAARIYAVACQDWNNNNSKCTDWYFAPTGLNEGHVRNMFKVSRLEGLKALDNYAVLDLSVIEPGRRTMAFTKTTDVPTLAPAGYIEIELDGRPAYIQVVR